MKPLLVVKKMVGMDLAITSMVVLPTGESIGNARYFAKDEKKLAETACEEKAGREKPREGTTSAGSSSCSHCGLDEL